FGPLKTAMSNQLSKLFAMEISRLQKIEWIEKYKAARLAGITSQNILGGWRGSGLFPTNRHRVLRLVSERSTPSPSIVSETTTPYLISSSPPDINTLRSANKAFNEALVNTTLATPIRQHSQKLSRIAEHLHADNSILRRENAELKSVISARKERLAGKRIILKGKFIVSTEEIQKELAEAERKTQEKRSKKGQRRARSMIRDEELEDESMDDESESEEQEIRDCIVVALV